jgi:hypothetical protein
VAHCLLELVKCLVEGLILLELLLLELSLVQAFSSKVGIVDKLYPRVYKVSESGCLVTKHSLHCLADLLIIVASPANLLPWVLKCGLTQSCGLERVRVSNVPHLHPEKFNFLQL